MRACSLLIVLVAAKAMSIPVQALAASPWAPMAYFAPDVLVAVIAAGLDFAFRRPRVGWWIYAAAVLYIAVNVPIAGVLGSPLTLTMIRAARGTLADSIGYYVTWGNGLRMMAIASVGALAPLVLKRLPGPEGPGLHTSRRPGCVRWSPGPSGPGFTIATSLALVAVLALAPFAASRVDTAGRERNAFTALLPLRLPTVTAAPAVRDWRASPMPTRRRSPARLPRWGPPPAADLSRYRGSASDMNIVMVALESTGAGYLRPYGAADDPMPNLTRLAERALLFQHAYAAYPESIKGLFGVLCSSHPVFNEPAEALATRPCDSIARALGSAGYRTALFHSGRFGYLGMDAVLAGRGFDLLEDAGAIGGNVRSSFGVDEPATVDRILRWIDNREPDRRFFVSYLPIAGHHPYGTPEPGPFRGDSELVHYKNALHYADAALGRLLEGLRSRHLDDRTVVVVFGDHGEAFGQHPGNVGHVLHVHDENVRVPLLIRIPGVTNRPERVEDVASVIDTAPTLLDLVGLPPARGHQGASLLRAGPRMALFLTDYALGWLGLRDGCWKYQLEVESGRSKLFDGCADPGETRNLADREPARVKAYRERVQQWSAAARLSRSSSE